MAKVLMVQGTGSNVGKSLWVAGLCRLFRNQGYKVAPFKAQNMANNSFVTRDGGEIGRAQATQAQACGVEPSVLMNPVLLKPATDRKSQVVVLGKPKWTLSAREYQARKRELIPIVEKSLKTLMDSHDLVVIEGAGSPAEINLKKQDIVNMAVAKKVKAPVILVGDIDKGGVFAQLVGTYELLDPGERKLVKAFLINKFRGDERILDPGLRWLEKRTKVKVLGVLPFLQDHEIPEEDSVVLQDSSFRFNVDSRKLLIHVVRLPRISNFTDFEALSREKDVLLQYVHKPNRHCLPDLLIIPGSKSTMADLKFLWDAGFAAHARRCLGAGVPVLGICGGYQMLGEKILDPRKVEGDRSRCEGLGLLPTVTVFRREKEAAQVRAVHLESGLEIEGYEIHMGCTQGRNGHRPLFKIVERHGLAVEDFDGLAVRQAGEGRAWVMGTYIHGLFDQPGFRRYFLDRLKIGAGLSPEDRRGGSGSGSAEDHFDRLAKVLEEQVGVRPLEKLLA